MERWGLRRLSARILLKGIVRLRTLLLLLDTASLSLGRLSLRHTVGFGCLGGFGNFRRLISSACGRDRGRRLDSRHDERKESSGVR